MRAARRNAPLRRRPACYPAASDKKEAIMRLSLLILTLALPAAAAGAAPQADQNGSAARKCRDEPMVALGQKDRPQPRRLGELPPGQLYLTVDRKVGGCRIPVIVRYGVGAGGGR
jgi:hypothetical protein